MDNTMDKIVALCKRRGFIYQSSEIYGGLNGFWDYGPLGVELKRNVKDAWWRDMITNHDEFSVPPGAPQAFSMVGLDCSIIMHPQVWKCSGHYDLFHDFMVDCRECQARFRVDHVKSSECPLKPSKHPGEHDKCKLTEPREFNLMFKTTLGALGGAEDVAFLRPETAQGMFVNFKNVADTVRVKVPFGVAQIGKSFRNEINPRNFTFRSREFEQMEMEFFCKPGSDDKWFEYWVEERKKWYASLGIKMEKLRFRAHEKEKLSHYSKATTDVEYLFPFGWGELEGIANRTDYDLRQHQIGMRSVGKWKGEELQDFQLVDEDPEWSSGKLSYFDDEEKRRYIPYVIEPAAGADRATLAFLCDAYDEDIAGSEERVVLRLHPRLAP